MQQIADFLQRFTLIEDPKRDRMKVLGIISECLKINLPEESLKVNGNKLVLTLQPTLKSVIFTQKSVIIKAIEETLSKKGLQIIFK